MLECFNQASISFTHWIPAKTCGNDNRVNWEIYLSGDA